MEFQSSEENLWKSWLGVKRFDSYASLTQDLDVPEIATWNQKISAALLLDISHVEIALRNRLASELQARLSKRGLQSSWTLDPTGGLNKLGGSIVLGRIESARELARRAKKEPSDDDLVSEMSLGFWLSLISKSFQPLHPDLVAAFSGLRGRDLRSLRIVANNFRVIRNRVAHHNRILHRDLERDFQVVLSFAYAISPSLAEFVRGSSSTLVLIDQFKQFAQLANMPPDPSVR